MKTILVFGSIIVTAALVSYTLAIFTEQKKHVVSAFVLRFLTLGVLLDITATICMIIGSTNTPFTIHGLLGYSALSVMVIDAILLWKFRFKNGLGAKITKKLHLYSRFAYLWWVVAYITGSLIVVINKT